MSNLDDKIKQVKIDIKNNKNDVKTLYIRKLILIIMSTILGLAIISFVIFEIIFNRMIDNNGLMLTKIFCIINIVLSSIGILISIILTSVLHNINKGVNVNVFLSGLYVVLFFAWVIFSFSQTGDTIFIKSVYYDVDQKIVYYKKIDNLDHIVYEVGYIEENSDVTLYGEVNGIEVTSFSTKFNKSVKTITIKSGNWNFKQRDFSNASNLKKIEINDAEVNVAEQTFRKNYYLNEIHINNSTFKVAYTKASSKYKEYSDMAIFNNSNIDIYLNNSSLINLVDTINLLDISGISKVSVPEKLKCIGIFSANKAVINDDVDLIKCDFKNYFEYRGGCAKTTYLYPLGQQIYLPSTITSIPDNFFGSSNCNIKVFYEGSEEEWNKIFIGNTGNDNYFSGNVLILYNSK